MIHGFRFTLSLITLIALLPSCQSSDSLSMTEEERSSVSSADADVRIACIRPEVDMPTSSLVVAVPRPSRSAVVLQAPGEQITFDQEGDNWYAETSQGKLPVKSTAQFPIKTYLSWLVHQERSVVRSRLHMISSAASPTGDACVYLGRLGLLGGSPTFGWNEEEGKIQELLKQLNDEVENQEKWVRALTLSFQSDATALDPKIWEIDTGYCYQDHRVVYDQDIYKITETVEKFEPYSKLIGTNVYKDSRSRRKNFDASIGLTAPIPAVLGEGGDLAAKFKRNRDRSEAQDHEDKQELISNNRILRFSGHVKKKKVEGVLSDPTVRGRTNKLANDVAIAKLVLLICIRPEEEPKRSIAQEQQHEASAGSREEPGRGYGCDIL